MGKRWLLTTFVAVVPALLGIQGVAGQNVTEPAYRFEPALTGDSPRQTAIQTDAQKIVVIEKDEKEANLRLQTETPISPYVGAERVPVLSPEERRLLPEEHERAGLGDYKLEAGIGVYVEDKASLNLGYRFRNPPSLLDERRNDPLPLTGDLRITFDVKFPF